MEFIVAPFEADAQMAYLAVNGLVHSVITEDSDMLPYGCPRVSCILLPTQIALTGDRSPLLIHQSVLLIFWVLSLWHCYKCCMVSCNALCLECLLWPNLCHFGLTSTNVANSCVVQVSDLLGCYTIQCNHQSLTHPRARTGSMCRLHGSPMHLSSLQSHGDWRQLHRSFSRWTRQGRGKRLWLQTWH